jgi:hypothetical protein
MAQANQRKSVANESVIVVDAMQTAQANSLPAKADYAGSFEAGPRGAERGTPGKRIGSMI